MADEEDQVIEVRPASLSISGEASTVFVSGMSAAIAAWRPQYAAAVAKVLGFSTALPEPEPDLPELLISAEIVVFGDAVAEGRLVEAVALPWSDILEALARDPNLLHQMNWRRVEELIAAAYKREGWPEVILTDRSGDRGRDIIASKPGFGAIRFYDQVKAYSPGNKVPADDVRAIFGVLNLHPNVSKAVITTTALFAPGVYEEFKPVMPNRLELRDGPRLREWLIGLGKIGA